MSELTLKAIEQLLDKKLDQKLEPINTKLAAIEETVSGHTETLVKLTETVSGHTTTLDVIAKDVKTLLDEKTISAARVDRLEHWAQQVGPQVDIKLEL